MSALATNGLPSYAAELSARHRAHRAELKRMIDDLPLHPGDRVLDMACGDGLYLHWLSGRVGPVGCVVGADATWEYLRIAEQTHSREPRATLVAAQIESLPFSASAFDFVWCAQSLISFPEPLPALASMMQVLRPGGILAVMENDSLHEMVLSWPEELELAVRIAELQAYQADTRRPEKRYLGRRLRGLLRRVGLTDICKKSYAVDRMAPLSDADTEFLGQYLGHLQETAFPFLDIEGRVALERLVDPNSPNFLLRQPGFEATWFYTVCWGTKPTGKVAQSASFARRH